MREISITIGVLMPSATEYALPYVASLHLKDTMGNTNPLTFRPWAGYRGLSVCSTSWTTGDLMPLDHGTGGPIIQELGLAKALGFHQLPQDLGLVIPRMAAPTRC